MAVINGDNLANNLVGTTVADTIHGNGGNDTIYAGGATSGLDRLYGDAGHDTMYANGSGSASLDGGIGNDTLIGDASGTETLLGGADADDIRGGGGDDHIEGGAGNDLIDTGADVVRSGFTVATDAYGGDGADQFRSSGGISNLYGGGDDDTFYSTQGLSNGAENYFGGTEYDQIVVTGNFQNIGINDISDVELIDGGTFSNIVIQTANTNTLGTHVLDLSGTQLVNISLIEGQNYNDLIILEGSLGAGENLALSRDDIVEGGSGNDLIAAGFGSDIIRGEAGDDFLFGGLAADTLIGGTGADQFALDHVNQSIVGLADLITDFNQSEGDGIAFQFDADSSAIGYQEHDFIGTDAFTGVAGEIRYEHMGGNTHIFATTDYDPIADLEIVIQGIHTLTTADIS